VKIVYDAAAPLTSVQWLSDAFDFWAFDRSLDELAERDEPLRVAADAIVLRQITIRAQRLADTRNAASSEPWFDRVLGVHRSLHDLEEPLARADLDHALDTWQWTLTLDPDAPAHVQLAALLHDIDRLDRVPKSVFEDGHALAGVGIARALLACSDVPAPIVAAAVELVGHEGDTQLIDDADGLSFFSLDSTGYLAYFGVEQTERKVAYTLARMSRAARERIPSLRMLRPIWIALERSQRRAS
jgi:hypothetical protein